MLPIKDHKVANSTFDRIILSLNLPCTYFTFIYFF